MGAGFDVTGVEFLRHAGVTFIPAAPRKLVTLPARESVEQEVIRWCDNH